MGLKRFIQFGFLIFVALGFSSCLRFHAGVSKIEQVDAKPLVFPTNFKKALYKTNIHFWKKDFSGLMFFKQNNETEETRIVFMSEVGLKFFDFKLDKNGVFSVEYILDELNKPSLISVLEKDIKLILQKGYKQSKVKYFIEKQDGNYLERYKSDRYRLYYSFDKQTNMVSQIDFTGSVFKKIRMILKSREAKLPTEILIKHYGLRLQLKLRLIE